MENRRFIFFRCALVAAVLAGMACVGLSTAANAGTPLPISGLSPYPDGGDPDDPWAVTACNGGPQLGVLYRNSETEPYIAVNPTDADNMIACWHQDRWSTGSAQGVGAAYTFDGGATWTYVNVPFTHCSGGMPRTGGDFERASDPWISFGPDGAAYFMALVSDRSTSRNGMAVAKSTDGGVTWSTPTIIKDHDARGVRARSLFHDKNSITADPHDPNFVYATWTLFRNGFTALVVSRSTDGGQTWEPARPVNKLEVVERSAAATFRQGAQIVVLPDGTLVNAFFRVLADPRGGLSFVGVEQAIFRSRDQGKHWERLDTPVAPFLPSGGFDVELGIFVRDAGLLPDMAVDNNSGNLYVVWQDGRFSEFGASTVLISRSLDGGDTWSPPVPVSDAANPIGQEFLPAVAVAADGTVGVLYYDFRNDTFGDAVLSTDVYLATLSPELSLLGEERLSPQSFDMRQMLITGDRGYFPGDYVGLDAAGNDFVAAFTVSNDLGLPVEFPQDNSGLRVDNHNRQDIVFTRVLRGPLASKSRTMAGTSGKMPANDRVTLQGNFPNPFNPQTTIQFDIPTQHTVRLQIFDVTGRPVRSLLEGVSYPPGRHDVVWDGRNDSGQFVASGVYLYRLSAGGFVDTKRMVLMK